MSFHRPCLPMLLIVLLLPATGRAEEFKGTFSGEGMMLTLQPAEEQIRGTLIYDEEFYSVKADEKDGQLAGTFFTDRGEFEFSAAFSEGLLEFESNGIVYYLCPTGGDCPDPPQPEAEIEDVAVVEEDVTAVADSQVEEEAEEQTADPETVHAEGFEAGTVPASSKTVKAPAEPKAPMEPKAPTEPQVVESGADEPPVSGGVVSSMDFEEGTAPAGTTSRSEKKAEPAAKPKQPSPKPTPAEDEAVASMDFEEADEEASAGADEEASAGAEVDVELDEALVGAWEGSVASGSGSLLAGATSLELDADGSFAAAGTSARGRWKAEDRTLFLRPGGSEDWQAYCRYKLVADTLLCTVDEDTRQLWHRRR